eukprot:323672-Rhodomonas_salina.1
MVYGGTTPAWGTEIAYRGTWGMVARSEYAVLSQGRGVGVTRAIVPYCECVLKCAMPLPACYAMSGTDLGYAATKVQRFLNGQAVEGRSSRRGGHVPPMLLRAALAWRMLCAMSGTDIGYTHAIVLRVCYAVSGTEIGYAATRTYELPH